MPVTRWMSPTSVLTMPYWRVCASGTFITPSTEQRL
jgi:hypothetical protein